MWSVGRPDAKGILDDPGVKEALPRYIDVVRKKAYPKFMIADAYSGKFSRADSTEHLWEIHDAMLEGFKAQDPKKPKKVNRSFLELKALIAHRVMGSCSFCERDCGVDRVHGERGFCGAGRNFSLFSAFPHMGEEPELVPSGTIFTGGCSIRCIHCQNWDISQWKSGGESLSPEMMALQVKDLANAGCYNLNMVGGDPTPYLWHWIETFRHVKERIATVWNSNSYHSLESAKLLAGFIDLYLLDFKYGNDDCATQISDAPGYWEAATRNHLWAKEHGELIIRVLVLPGHNKCCTRPILQWIHDKLGPMTRGNLMFQYRPEWRAGERPELNRKLTQNEIDEARKMADEIGLKNLVRD